MVKSLLKTLWFGSRKRTREEPELPPLPKHRLRPGLKLRVIDERMLTEAGKRATRNGILYCDEVDE